MKPRTAIALALAFTALAPGFAVADAILPPPMLPDASNALLPTARNNLGIGGGTLPFGIRDDSTATPAAGGSGNSVGDALTLNDGCTTHGVLAVNAVATGAVTQYVVTNRGNCTSVPSNPVSVLSSTGGGSGATFTLNYGPLVAGLLYGNLTQNSADIFLGGGTPNAGYAGGESIFIGDFAGGKLVGASNNVTALGHNSVGIGGACSTATGGNIAALGTDALRNYCGGSGLVALGHSALQNQSQSGGSAANNLTAVGDGSMVNLNTTVNSANDTALGTNSCKGANGATFQKGGCLGTNTGGALSSANGFLLLGQGVGNTTFASGSGVILIGSGNVAVDTPAAGTSNYLNIENLIVADTSAGHFTLQNGSAPAVTAGSTDCGTSPAISGNDNVGLVTVGSSTNGSKCTITFHTAWVTAPVCLALNQTTGNLLRPTSTNTTLTLNGTLTAADKLSFMCKGYAL